jgi:hypothetical protein
MDEFYKTRAGRQFIDSTMPRLAEELAKLNDSLDRLIEALERSTAMDQTPEQP